MFKMTILIAVIAIFFENTVNAQMRTRIAVLDFKAGAGVTQSDVDGISAILITYLNNDFTIVERTQIDKVINEQRFQRSSLTQQEMVRIGKILNVAKIVIGDVNLLGGLYNLDIRSIDVQTGVTEATAGETFQMNNIRPVTQRLANTLGAGMKQARDIEARRLSEERRIAEERATEQRRIAEQKEAEERRISEEYKRNINLYSVVINGVRWARFNVGERGRFVSREEESGHLYTWIQAKTACPQGWRLPTQSELRLLEDERNGSSEKGWYFGRANNNIFLPYNTTQWHGAYWGGSQFEVTFGFAANSSVRTGSTWELQGVRCVCE